MSNYLINELNDIVEQGLENTPLPYKKGNSIRIGNIVIRTSKKGYLIYNTETNKQVCKTFCKASALAIAKNLAEGRNITKRVLDLDHTIQKYYNDALFYKHTIKKTKDEFIKETRGIRLTDALDKTRQARNNLDKFIFGC